MDDLLKRFRDGGIPNNRAKNLRGPRLILTLAPCPPGWDFDPQPPQRNAALIREIQARVDACWAGLSP